MLIMNILRVTPNMDRILYKLLGMINLLEVSFWRTFHSEKCRHVYKCQVFI